MKQINLRISGLAIFRHLMDALFVWINGLSGLAIVFEKLVKPPFLHETQVVIAT